MLLHNKLIYKKKEEVMRMVCDMWLLFGAKGVPIRIRLNYVSRLQDIRSKLYRNIAERESMRR